MSTDRSSFIARWSRLKHAAEREAAEPANAGAPEMQAPPGNEAGAADVPVSSAASLHVTAPATETPLPPIESLDGLRSDYEAFFRQPVDEELRHAALKKLFADPHFNQMDMLDVYVDDYTQFEPLPPELRLRLPSARSFLLDSERAALEAEETAKSSVVDPGARQEPVVAPGAGTEVHAVADAAPGCDSPCPSLSADDAASGASVANRPVRESSSDEAGPGVATESASSSS